MMNALKFLAVDRSLDSGKDCVGRFQMREPGMLPVLNERRPATVATKPEVHAKPQKPGRSMWRRLVGWVGRNSSSDMNAKAAPVENQPELQPVREVVPEVSVATAQAVDSKPDGGGRFARFAGYNPFHRTEKKVVQAEFRFENVRVVCNELHDTDFIIKT